MRKTVKSAVSVVLSAALALTMGGIGTLTNNTAAKAADAKPDFNAKIQCFGNFYGWDKDTPEDETATVHVTDFGEYSVSMVAPDAYDDVNEMSGAFIVNTDLTAVPTDYTVVGKSFTSGDQTYNWTAEAYLDGDNVRLSARNEWGDEKANTLTAQTVPIKAGDTITFTFEVKDPSAAPADPTAAPADPTVAPADPTTAPTDAPAADGKPSFTAGIECWGNFFGWDTAYPEDATAKVTVSDYGEYSVSMVAPDAYDDINEMSGAFVVNTSLTAVPTAYTVAGKSIKVADQTYNWPAEAYLDGDNVRMSARNEWGDEKANTVADQVIPIKSGDTITFTFTVTEGAASVPESPEPTVAPAKTYNAYLGFQTDAWDYRDEYEKDANSTTYKFDSQVMIGGEATDADVKNAVISDNGTYSVSISGVDLTNASKFNMLYVSTDIPATMKNVKLTDVKVLLDGKEVATLKEASVKKEVQSGSKKYYMYMAINGYGDKGVDLPDEFDYDMPSKSMELQFTISGLDLNKDYSTKTYGAKKGTKFTSGNLTYKVTKAATITAGKVKAGKVEVVGLKNKKAASVSVADTVKFTANKQKATYTVSSVAAGAFKGASAKAITLGKNIKSVKKNTFVNCKKLAKLTVKAKLSSVAKNSFKGCKKTIKVSGASVKANVKKLQKSGYKKFK